MRYTFLYLLCTYTNFCSRYGTDNLPLKEETQCRFVVFMANKAGLIHHTVKSYLYGHAPTNRNTSIANCYRKHEAEKKRVYEQRILEVEHSTFTTLVFSATEGMAKQCSTFYKRLTPALQTSGNTPIARPYVG